MVQIIIQDKNISNNPTKSLFITLTIIITILISLLALLYSTGLIKRFKLEVYVDCFLSPKTG
ncbi:MAG: hypothetical protein K8S00_08955, partial [Bacteroidales bacterium]|nr:hypothetical protein [Bacteroidales bacterium]